jgi:hypothetical protein
MSEQEMRIITDGQLLAVPITGGEAAVVGEYWASIDQYLRGGAASPLAAFTGVSIQGWPLEIDPVVIADLARSAWANGR